jgi:hypothetical protein
MFNRTIMYAKLAWVYAKGMCGFRHSVYDLKFVFDDKMWYIDMPWPGDRYNLAMVAGSNHLLTFLDTKKENRVRLLVRPSKKRRTDLDGYFECVKQHSGLFAGATYKVNGIEGFTREIWICPVTLTVLGHYPQYIYIKQIANEQ